MPVGSSEKVLLVVGILAVLVGVLALFGVVQALVRRVFAFLRAVMELGFWLWERVLAGIPWPLLLLLIVGVHVLLYYHSGPFVTLLLGFFLLHVGFICCLAYIAIDQERLDVARGYKALYNPAKGQQLAERFSTYGARAGLPLLLAATLACVSGFALLNQGLAGSIGENWYAFGYHSRYLRLNEAQLVQLQEAAAKEPAVKQLVQDVLRLSEGQLDQLLRHKQVPGYPDFLVYSLLSLVSAFDLLDVINLARFDRVSYVHPNAWPASLMLVMFRTFFTAVLLQQILSVFGKDRLIQESVRDFWSPHEPIQRRARENLVQLGGRAVRTLLRSLEQVEYVTPEQREFLLGIIVTVGPSTSPLLLERLEHPRDIVREIAMEGLGRLKALETLTRLVRFRLDDHEGVRLSLVEALAMIAEEGPESVRKRWRLQRKKPAGRAGWWSLGKEVSEPEYDPVALTVQTLQQLLDDPSRAVREGAARLLGRLGVDAQAAAAELAKQMADPEEGVREQAVRALGAIAGPVEVAIPALIARLEAEEVERVRVAVLEALGRFGEAASAAAVYIVPLVQDRDEEIRTAAAEALRQIGLQDAGLLPHLVEGLKSPDNQVRIHAAEAIGIIGPVAREAVPALITALRDQNARVRVRVARALGQLGEAAVGALPMLCQTLRDADFEIAAEAARALGAIGPAAASGALASLLKASQHPNPGVRRAVAEALVAIEAEPSAVLPRLAEMTRDLDAGVREAALAGLTGKTDLGQPRRDAFLAALEDEEPEVRAVAVRELPFLDLPREELVERLLTAIADVGDEVQVEAVRALAELDPVPDEVVERLCRLLTEDSEALQVEALRALARIGPRAEAAVPVLFHIMQRARMLVRAEVLHAAAAIGPEKAAALFLGGLHDSDSAVRVRASAGLSLLTEIPEDQIANLTEAMKDPEPCVRATVVALCVTKGLVRPEMYPLLVACTTEPDDELRLNALRGLRDAPVEMLEEVLPRLLADANAHIRLLAAARLLARDSEHAEARQAARDTLYENGPPPAGQVQALLRDLDPETAQAFELVLAEIIEAEENTRGARRKEEPERG